MIDQLWPGRYHSKTLREVTARRAAKELELAAGSAIEIDWQNFLKLPLTDLEESLRMERARREIIQRRALVFLGYAAIVTALTLGTLNLIESDSSALSLGLRIRSDSDRDIPWRISTLRLHHNQTCVGARHVSSGEDERRRAC